MSRSSAFQPSSFTLRTLIAADIPACATLAGLAFETDRHTQLKARSPRNPYDHADGMRGGLSYWLGQAPSGAVEVSVAVDSTSGEPVGWVAWGFRGFDSAQTEARRGAREPEELEELKRGKTEEREKEVAKEDGKDEADEDEGSARTRLEARTGADMDAWMQRLMPPGAKCMYICSIVVHPAAQGRGVGAALVRKGTDRADAEGVYCWVHASEDGGGLFAKHGFKEVGRLELDLDSYNIENVAPPEGSDVKWGSYTFRYMRRERQKPGSLV